MLLVFAVAAAFGMLALFATSHPETMHTVIGSVRLTDVAVVSPLPATRPSLIGGGLATDDTDDQAQQQEQQDMQLAQEQNDAAEQQFNQGMQQEQTRTNSTTRDRFPGMAAVWRGRHAPCENAWQ